MALSLIFPVAIGFCGYMDNSANPDQMALSEAIWSRFTLFPKEDLVRFSIVRVFSDVLVAFLHFDICHY